MSAAVKSAGADRPYRLVGDDRVGGARPAGHAALQLPPRYRWRRRHDAAPAFAQMQMIAFRPARQAACALAATSPSLAVMLAALGMADDREDAASFSISAEMSPVWAPEALG